MKELTRRNFIKYTGVGCAGVVLCGLAGCSTGSTSSSEIADTVVYGKIYTSNSKQEYAEALAVKDGKYIFVGSEDGVKQFIKDGTTIVIDHKDKGLIMAGATEGHGHYVMDGVLDYMNFTVTGSSEDEIVANVKKFVEEHPNNKAYYTFGWDNQTLNQTKFSFNMRPKLDAICSDKPMLIVDNSGHSAFANSKAFEIAGVTKDTVVPGGQIVKTEDGELSGLVTDMADTMILKKAITSQDLITEDDYEGICKTMEKKLHAYGYTYYHDGCMNYFGPKILDCIYTYDNKIGLSILASGSHKIDPYDDWKSEIDAAEERMKKYKTDHLKYNSIKLFADGEAVESKSGWLKEEYADGTHGTQTWETETFNNITKTANERGLAIHVHSQGDAATEQVVNACIAAESTKKEGVLNGICHGRNISEDSKKKMAEHNIYAAQNINWRTLIPKSIESQITEMFSMEICNAGYPIKSLIDAGVLVTSSTDVPAASGAPVDVCSIIEIAVNDTRSDMEIHQLDPNERVSLEQALDIMTINGAKQLQVEDVRGSIETGKYADFVLLNKDITTCDKDKIHEGEVETVYFEGKEVYTK
jgi:predicted amidohydrolase YtcJ